jgi:hypothetical protein
VSGGFPKGNIFGLAIGGRDRSQYANQIASNLLAACPSPAILDISTIQRSEVPNLRFEIAFHTDLAVAKSTVKNMHFFEENRQKQGCFVPQCQKLSWGVKICQ